MRRCWIFYVSALTWIWIVLLALLLSQGVFESHTWQHHFAAL
jgi:hypothetical protein